MPARSSSPQTPKASSPRSESRVITFGYVYGVPSQVYLHSVSVNFIHYPDLGWIVSSLEK